MNQYFREFIFYHRRQRAGILMLALLILIIVGIDISYPYLCTQRSLSADSTDTHSKQLQELQLFLSEVSPQRSAAPQKRVHHSTPGKRFAFNPNTADSAQLSALGLPAWMIGNVLHYRAKGGRFRQAADFKKIYGLSEELYASLLPYIRIPADTSRTEIKKAHPAPLLLTTAHDTVRHIKTEKYAPSTVVELNTADTTELKKIPGIGSGIAQMMVAYRKKLGGFYDIRQLADIHLNFPLLQPWLRIDSTQIERIPVNRASVARLLRHPYINFYQAKALVDYRKKKGPIHSLKPFALLEEFTAQDLDRISHYLDFQVTPPAN